VSLEDIVERIPLTAPSADALGLELASFVQVLAGRPGTVVTGIEGRAALALALRVAGSVGRQPAVVGGS
jgi:hypothetical protein